MCAMLLVLHLCLLICVRCYYFLPLSTYLCAMLSRWSKVAVSRHILEDLLPGPVTVVGERHAELNPLLNPGSHLVAIRIPDHYFMQQLLHMCDGPIGLTSANKSASQSTLSLDVRESCSVFVRVFILCDCLLCLSSTIVMLTTLFISVTVFKHWS